MRVAHVSVDLRLGNQRSYGVNNNNVDRAGPHHGFRDLKGLFSAVRLGDIQIIDIDADILRIDRVQSMLGIDESGDAAALLHLGDHVQRQGCFTGGFRPVYLHDSSFRYTSKAQRYIKGKRTGRNRLHIHPVGRVPEPHDRTLAIRFLNLHHSGVERLLLLILIHRTTHNCLSPVFLRAVLLRIHVPGNRTCVLYYDILRLVSGQDQYSPSFFPPPPNFLRPVYPLSAKDRHGHAAGSHHFRCLSSVFPVLPRLTNQ